jgi:hypothetical protein
MTRLAIAALTAMAPLAACAATGDPAPQRLGDGECNAEGVQDLVGQKATQDVGAELMAKTGARTLRWVPPRTAVTMDFRADRLTVSYDDNLVIERISCG